MSRGSMPSMVKILRYWSSDFTSVQIATDAFGDRFEARYIGWGEPFCFGCKWLAPVDDTQKEAAAWTDAASWFERAHIVPVSFGGDNEPRNLVPLCRTCHKEFDKEVFSGRVVGRNASIGWLNNHPRKGYGDQLLTDFLYREHDGDPQSALEDFQFNPVYKSDWSSFQQCIIRMFYGQDIRQETSP